MIMSWDRPELGPLDCISDGMASRVGEIVKTVCGSTGRGNGRARYAASARFENIDLGLEVVRDPEPRERTVDQL